MANCCDRIEHFLLDSNCLDPYIQFLNNFMKHLGSFLVIVVHFLIIVLTFTSFLIILPYEQLYQPPALIGLYFILGIFLLSNIFFHYTKARTLPAVTRAGKEGDRWCSKCEYFKSDRTHHCAVCRQCVLGMDHHCIWINQCVGSHNHRHFFLFIVYLTVAMFVIVTAGFHSFLDHAWMVERHYCSEELPFAPLQEFICRQGDLARNCIIFAYLLSALLMLLVGGLTLWNAYLISNGFTYIDYLKHHDLVAEFPGYKNPLNKGIPNNWKNFLGLRRNRTFVRHVLFPSSHLPILYDSYGRVEQIGEHVV